MKKLLGAALTYSASSGADLLTASAQLGAYSLGLALPLVAAAFAAERVLAWTRRLRAGAPALQKLTGALMVATGVLLATDHLGAIVPRAEGSTGTTVAASCDAEQGAACTAPAASPTEQVAAEIPLGSPRLIEFMSSHCPACARMTPVMARIERACASTPHAIVRVSLDDPSGRGLAGRYRVQVLPTFMLIDAAGNEVERFVGEHTETKLAMAVESVRGEAEKLDECLFSLESYLHSEDANFDPLVHCFLVHYQFETIHPFEDGNGRVGRLLLAIMLEQRCGLTKPWLYLSEFFERHRDEYVDCLFSVSTTASWTRWCELCLQGTLARAKSTITRCRRLLEVREDYARRVAEVGGHVRLTRIIQGIFTKTFYAPEVFKVSYDELGNEGDSSSDEP